MLSTFRKKTGPGLENKVADFHDLSRILDSFMNLHTLRTFACLQKQSKDISRMDWIEADHNTFSSDWSCRHGDTGSTASESVFHSHSTCSLCPCHSKVHGSVLLAFPIRFKGKIMYLHCLYI